MSTTQTIQREKVFIDPKFTTAQIREKYNLPSKAAWVAKKKAFTLRTICAGRS